MDVDVSLVAKVDESAIDQWNWPLIEGDLRCMCRTCKGRPRHVRSKPCLRDFSWSHARAQALAEGRSQLAKTSITERSNARTATDVGMFQGVDEGEEGRIGLAVDVQTNFWPCLEEFGEGRDVFSTVDLDLLRFFESDLADLDIHPTCTQQILVVEGEEKSVLCCVYISFEIPITESHRMGERRHRVLGMDSSPAAMGECNGPWRIEVGVHEAYMERPKPDQYSSLSSLLYSFPVGCRGSSDRKSTLRGHL